jgi:hypothetical protein
MDDTTVVEMARRVCLTVRSRALFLFSFIAAHIPYSSHSRTPYSHLFSLMPRSHLTLYSHVTYLLYKLPARRNCNILFETPYLVT